MTNCSFPRESASSRCRGATPLVGTCSSRWPTLARHSAHVGVCAAEVSAAGAATPLRTAAPQRVTHAVHPAGRGAAGAWWSSTSSSCCSQPSAPTRSTAPWCSRQRLRPARPTWLVARLVAQRAAGQLGLNLRALRTSWSSGGAAASALDGLRPASSGSSLQASWSSRGGLTSTTAVTQGGPRSATGRVRVLLYVRPRL